MNTKKLLIISLLLGISTVSYARTQSHHHPRHHRSARHHVVAGYYSVTPPLPVQRYIPPPYPSSTENTNTDTVGTEVKNALAGIRDGYQASVAVSAVVEKAIAAAIAKGENPSDAITAVTREAIAAVLSYGDIDRQTVISGIVQTSVQAAIKGKTGDAATTAATTVINAAKEAAPNYEHLITQAANYAIYNNIIDLAGTGNTTTAVGTAQSFFGSTYSEAQTDIFQFLRSNIQSATNLSPLQKTILLNQVDKAQTTNGLLSGIGGSNIPVSPNQ